MNLNEYFANNSIIVRNKIQQLLKVWNFSEPLNSAISHILESGGKFLRPILTFLSCESVGGNINSVIDAAIAIELIHNASLLWDDVIDSDELRRGRITVHKKWNKNIAILAGGMLASKALELISNQTELLDLFSKALGKMIEGQVLDITNILNANNLFDSKSENEIFEILRKRFRMKALEGMEWEESRDLALISEFTDFEEERDYFEMISYKTSALIKLATRIGATIANGTSEEIETLSNYGLYLGLAFQVKDDLIGLISNKHISGKPAGSDLRQGKLNLYTIFALRNLEDKTLQKFLHLLPKIDDQEIFQEIRQILVDSGAIDYLKTKMLYIAQKANDSLLPLRDSRAKQILLELIRFTIEREF